MNNVNIIIDPEVSLIDEKITLKITGLNTNEKVKIKAFSPDFHTIKNHGLKSGRFLKESNYISFGIFTADNEGNIDLSETAPSDGTYTSKDSMGLFWSMKPSKSESYNLGRNLNLVPIIRYINIIISVEKNDTVLASKEFRKYFINDDVKVKDVVDNSLVGKFFYKQSQEKRPAIIVLGGLEGNIYIAQKVAGFFASHGYPSLALAYFNMDNLPSTIENLPLEYIEKAIDYLKTNEFVDAEKIIIYGQSMGGELALAAATTFKAIHGAVAVFPSPIVFEGLSKYNLPTGLSSWSYENKPLPFAELNINLLFFGLQSLVNKLNNRPFRIDTEYNRSLTENEQRAEKAFLPLENINGPILLVSATDDYVWPSQRLCELAISRLDKVDFPFKYSHLNYHTEHSIALPNEPIKRVDLKGENIAFANKDIFDNIFNFLNEL